MHPPRLSLPSSPDQTFKPLVFSPVTPSTNLPTPTLSSYDRALYEAMLEVQRRHIGHDAKVVDLAVSIGNEGFLSSRHTVIEWMVDVASCFRFLPVTIHLAVRHLDWLFSLRRLPKRYWQLCAITCLFVAAKCEEAGSNVPLLTDLAFLCDNNYELDLIKKTECLVLQCLQWDLVVKTPIHFLDHFISVLRSSPHPYLPPPSLTLNPSRPSNFPDSDQNSLTSDTDSDCPDAPLVDPVHRLACCILEVALLDASIRPRFAPNVLAAAALSVAAEVYGQKIPSVHIVALANISEALLTVCAEVLQAGFDRVFN